MADVFLSYSHDDAERAKKLAQAIDDAGFSVWWDLRIRSGRFSKQIEEEIGRSRCVVVLWSMSSAQGDWVPAEADRGRVSGKLVQARLDPGTPIPLPFEWLHVLELTEWPLDEASNQLGKVLEAIRSQVQQPAMLRRLQRLWQPAAAPRLRPWDLLVSSAILTGAVAVMASWATGILSHAELALYLSGTFLAWLLWLMLRALIERWLAGAWMPVRRFAVGLLVSIVSTVAWMFAFTHVYLVPEFADDVGGLLLTRFSGDRWNTERNFLYEELSYAIREAYPESALSVAVANRRPRPDENNALLEASNATLLLTRPVSSAPRDSSHRIVFRNARGILPTVGRVLISGSIDSMWVNLGQSEPATIDAVVSFLAGYTQYRNGEYGRAMRDLETAMAAVRSAATDAELQLAGGRGVVPSIEASAAFFLANSRALLAEEEEDIEKAIGLYDAALAAVSRSNRSLFLEALSNKAALLIDIGRYENAAMALDSGAAQCSEAPRQSTCAFVHFNLGAAQVLNGQYSDAQRSFAMALDLLGQENDTLPAEEAVALEALLNQKKAWGIAKKLESDLLAEVAGAPSAAELRQAHSTLDQAERVWRLASQKRELPQFDISRARLDILDGDAASALPLLEELDIESAADGEPEVYLLLAIAQICTGGDSSEALREFTKAGSRVMEGMLYFRYWVGRCRADEGDLQ